MSEQTPGDNRFEFFKHMTTLNFAGAGFLAVLMQANLAKFPQSFPLVAGCFAVSIILSFIMMVFTMFPWNIENKEAQKNWVVAGLFIAVGAILSFLLGMESLMEMSGAIVFKPKQ